MRKIVYSILSSVIILFILCSCSDKVEANVMDTIRNAPIAKLETSDNDVMYVDSEIDLLKSFADLEIHVSSLEPTDNENDRLCIITFNPSEKVDGGNDVVVTFHDTYVQINGEFYLANDGVEYDSIIEWAKLKLDYFFQ